MEIGLDLGTPPSGDVVFGENTEQAARDDAAPVVNVHPNFAFGPDEVSDPKAFPSIAFGSQLIKAALDARQKLGLPDSLDDLSAKSKRFIGFSEEWNGVRAAWSLTRNGKTDLASAKMRKVLSDSTEMPESVPAWIFEFASRLCHPRYNLILEGVAKEIEAIKIKDEYKDFVIFYAQNMAKDHGRRYFEIYKAFFKNYNAFSQVDRLVASGVKLNAGSRLGSQNFEDVKLFYAEAFEVLSSQVEFITCLSNIKKGRSFDQLEKMKLSDYQKLDKASRFRNYEDITAFAELTRESDNQLRNASYHGGMDFNSETGNIIYRAGKGGMGDKVELSYAEYIARCVEIFLQILVLHQTELAASYGAKVTMPL